MRFMKERKGTGTMGEKFGGPQQMFRAMMGDTQKDDDLAAYGTSELRALFEDWLLQLEEEIIVFAKKRDTVKPEDVADTFKISRDSAIFVLDKLVRKGKINVNDSSAPKEDLDGNDG
jgi:hypothetical protein